MSKQVGNSESKPGFPRAVVKVSKRTGKIEARYESLSAAAEAEGRSKSALSDTCNDRSLPKGPYYYRFEDDYERFEDLSGKRNSPVICNGHYYDSLVEASKVEGIDYSLLARAVRGYAKLNSIRIWWA